MDGPGLPRFRCASWERTGLAEPKHGDRYTVVLADGQPRTYALLRERGNGPMTCRPARPITASE